MIKPALARGELHCVGATTLNEYRKHIEKDAALERRFQPIMVAEPSVEDTIAILRGLKERYEMHHGVRIKDSAIVAAATLSHRYITDRQLPDKAVDLIDEAASKLRMEIDSRPADIDEVERKITQEEIEREALRNGSRTRPPRSAWPRSKKPGRSEGKKRRAQGPLAKGKRGHQPHPGHQGADGEGQDRRGPGRAPGRSGPGRGNHLRPHAQPAKGAGRRKTRNWPKSRHEGAMLKEEVDAEDVAEVVAKWTGIPVTRLLEGEKQKLLHMEERIGLRVVGQEEAVQAVSNAVRRARSGLQDPNRPLGSFIFLGPPGWAKPSWPGPWPNSSSTRTCHGAPGHERIHGEAHGLRLIGAPPGYVGYEEGGQLTEAVRRRPYRGAVRRNREGPPGGVQLAAPDPGRRPPHRRPGPHRGLPQHHHHHDQQHRQPVYRRSGERGPGERPGHGGPAAPFPAGVFEPGGRHPDFPPPDPGTAPGDRGPADGQTQEAPGRAASSSWNSPTKAKEFLAEAGYDPVYGARPLRRAIQRYVQDKLAPMLLSGEFKEGDTILVDGDTDGLRFERRRSCLK
jgi:ATP-dependent Clp protease ATP-binding subunit ClpB